jgi:hypothetical protein
MPSALRPTRRRVLLGAAVLAVIVVAAILIFGGGSESTRYGYVTPQETGTGHAQPDIHAFGETVRLRTSRTTIEVRPTGYSSQPATAARAPSIGIDLSVRNVGGEPYLDQPSQAASVVLRGGDEADRIYDPVGSCRGVSPDTVRLGPGESRPWCIAFERTGRPDLFVYAPEVGLPYEQGAPEAAAWRLGGRGVKRP